MIIFFLLIKFSQTLNAIIDRIDRSGIIFEQKILKTINCESIDEDNYIFRGRFPNINDILKKEKSAVLNNRTIEGYKYVYFPEISKYNEYANLFPNSTILVLTDKPTKANNCHIILNLYGLEGNYMRDRVPYYISINKKTQYSSFYNYEGFEINFFCFIPIFIILFCVYFHKLCHCSILCYILQFYVFTRRLIILCIPLIVSTVLMKYIVLRIVSFFI